MILVWPREEERKLGGQRSLFPPPVTVLGRINGAKPSSSADAASATEPNGILHSVPRQHILPAAYLGGFSQSEDGRLRERPIWVARREGQLFCRSAESVARREDHYTLDEPITFGEEGPSLIVDELWSGSEGAPQETPDELEAAAATGVMQLRSWLMAVELLSQFFIRTPAYDERQERGSQDSGLELSRDEINGSRLLNLQRLRPAVLHASWTVRRAPSGELVTNDCGYMHSYETSSDSVGCAFALRRDLAVILFPDKEQRPILKNGDWLGVGIRQNDDLSADDVRSFNSAMAAHRPEIFGPTEAVVSSARLGFERAEVLPLGAEPLIPDEGSRWLREHEFDWFTLLRAAGADTPRGTTIFQPVEAPGSD